MACATLAALAPYCETNADAQAMVDQILAALPGALDDQGSLGSANADAFAVIGLVALGMDPGELKNADGRSVVDGLMSYVNETGDGFVYAGEDNALATEQGFRGLVALAKFDGKPCNIYDFRAMTAQPRAVLPSVAAGVRQAVALVWAERVGAGLARLKDR